MNLLKFIYNKCKVGVRIVLLFLVLIAFYHVFEITRKGQTYFTNLGTVEGWNYNTSRETSLYVVPENITTHLLPETFCTKPTSLLIIICSSPGNFVLRNVIRETWATDRKYAKFTVDIYFLVGQVNNVTMQEQIEQEFLEKNDVIQEHFIDSYNNLTIKSLMLLKLVTTHCLNKVNYVMKTDDDVYVNIPALVNYLQVNGTEDMLIGNLMKDVSPVRNRKSKWNAPYYLYKNSRYPHYLSGTGYVMSIDIVPNLYEASFHNSIFYLEDVYITGILSKEIRLKPKDHPGFTYRKREFTPCTYLWAITTHHLNETELKELHALILKTDFTKCEKPSEKNMVKGWDYKTSRDTRLYMVPENITTHLLPEKFCKTPAYLLIIICSSLWNFATRDAIRETWARNRKYANFTVDAYFLVGQVNNVTMQEQFEQEFLEKNDVIQEHFMDSYNNLTIKSLMLLKLVTTHCLNTVNYVMKSDDDAYVNLPPLVNYLQVNGTEDTLVGNLMIDVSPEQDIESKWYAPNYLYDKSVYPPYLCGSGYVMSVNIVPNLYEASFRHPIFYIEDVYVTGILAQDIGLNPIDHTGFTGRTREFTACTYLWAITTHHLNETDMKQLHKIILKTDFKRCKR